MYLCDTIRPEVSELNELLTAEQLSKILDLDPRTVRRYLRQGLLKGAKIGKEWRIRRDEVEVFMHAHAKRLYDQAIKDVEAYIQGQDRVSADKFQVCAILDCFVENQEAYEIAQVIVRHLNEGDHRGPAKYQYMYDKATGRGRYILWGPPDFLGRILTSVGRMRSS
jgi:excisionase family DNA binding protein